MAEVAVRPGYIVSLIAELWSSLVAKAFVAIISPILLALFYFLARHLYRAFQSLHYVNAALGATARTKSNGLSTEGPGFWLKLPIVRPPNYEDLKGNSIPVLMIATSKGGVGKTTLAGSLAAHFALQWTQRREEPNADRPLRVLVIDQDFQGSFSTLTVSIGRRYVQPSKANRLASGELSNGQLCYEAEPLSQDGMIPSLTISTIPAYYDLAQAENRLIIEWLFPLSDHSLLVRLFSLLRLRDPDPPRTKKDLRYLLAEALLHPQVQANYDLVIIDAPPRLTTAHMQSMCASTHLLIPTILDGLTGDSVARYLDQVATHKLGLPGDTRRAICPFIQPIGIVCTLLPNTPRNLSGPLTDLKNRIAAARLQPQIFEEACFIRQRPPYRDCAGERIAYASLARNEAYSDLRDEVDNLGYTVAERMGAIGRGWTPKLSSRESA
jgi:chromosome partitioning protein